MQVWTIGSHHLMWYAMPGEIHFSCMMTRLDDQHARRTFSGKFVHPRYWQQAMIVFNGETKLYVSRSLITHQVQTIKHTVACSSLTLYFYAEWKAWLPIGGATQWSKYVVTYNHDSVCLQLPRRTPIISFRLAVFTWCHVARWKAGSGKVVKSATICSTDICHFFHWLLQSR